MTAALAQPVEQFQYRPHQQAAHNARRTEPSVVLRWDRRQGKTVFALRELLHAALERPNLELAYVAPKPEWAYRIAEPYLIQCAFEHRPELAGAMFSRTGHSVTFKNGSRISLLGVVPGRHLAAEGRYFDGIAVDDSEHIHSPEFWSWLALSRGWSLVIRGR